MAGVPRVLLPEGAQVLAVLIGLLIKASVELSQGLTSLLEEAMSLALQLCEEAKGLADEWGMRAI